MFHFLFLDLLPFSSVESATRKMMIVTESLPRCSLNRDKVISLWNKVIFFNRYPIQLEAVDDELDEIGILLVSTPDEEVAQEHGEDTWQSNLKPHGKKIENLHHLTVRNFGVAHIGNVQKRRDGGHLRREYSGFHLLSCVPNLSCLKSHEASESRQANRIKCL